MPKRSAKQAGFPCQPENCFESRHLDGSEYKVYSVIKGFAHAGRLSRHGKDSKAPLLFTASIKPTLCNAVNLSKNQTYLLRDKLAEKGWIVLREEGTRRADGSVSPDTWEVIEHDGFAAAHPGSCPDYEFAPDFEAAQAAGVKYGQRLRESGPTPENLFGKMFNDPTAKAIAEVLSKLTDSEREAIREHLKTAEPKSVDLVLPVPKRRERRQSLSVGTASASDQSLSLERTSPYAQDVPVPKLRTHQSLNLGKNLSTAPVTSPHTPTHTTPATTIVEKAAEPKTGVCDVLKKNQNLNDEEAENEVAALLKEFVAQNDGEPGKCTRNQKRDLKELALRHGRQEFRAAARAWFAAHPWDSRTTDPFSAFIAGFDGYAAKKVHVEAEKAKREKQEVQNARATEFNVRKIAVDYSGKFDEEFLASLTQEDRNYIRQVADTERLEDMPPNNGRNYLVEQIEFLRQQREQAAARFNKTLEDGSW